MDRKVGHYSKEEHKILRDTGVWVQPGYVPVMYPMHTHDYFEAFIMISGSAIHVLNGQEYELKRGDVFTIMNDQVHGFIRANDLYIINLAYDPGFFDQPYSEIRSIPGFDPLFLVEPTIRDRRNLSPMLTLDENSTKHVNNLADFIMELQERDEKALYPVIRMNFTAMLSYLATQYDAQRGASNRIATLSRAMSYMEQHLSDPIRLSDIADSAFLSTRQLERLFKEYFSESPMKYLQNMRLRKALNLLVKQKANVASAARQCGFDDPAYFTRLFRATYGITPSSAKLCLDPAAAALTESAAAAAASVRPELSPSW